jgi:hypothetical protein
MISHHDALLALRTKLLTLEVATTGSTSLSATATGYERAAGSFITDGFRVGMEITGTSFTNAENTAAKTLTAVATLTLTAPGCVVEAAGTRTIQVPLPAGREWENIEFESVAGSPWVQEQYSPGPMATKTLGATAELEVLPQYSVNVYTPSGVGSSAAVLYSDKLLTLFAPNTALSIASGTLVVRTDVAPFTGQLLQAGPGYAVVPVTVPLRLRTTNSI